MRQLHSISRLSWENTVHSTPKPFWCSCFILEWPYFRSVTTTNADWLFQRDIRYSLMHFMKSRVFLFLFLWKRCSYVTVCFFSIAHVWDARFLLLFQGCTATVLLVWRDGCSFFAQCANVGDSACVIKYALMQFFWFPILPYHLTSSL